VKKAVLKKWYLTLSLILSLYLLVVTILGFTPLKEEAFMKSLNSISIFVLCYFVVELIVLFFLADNYKTFFKEQWISIIAVLSSLSITVLVDGAIAIGSLTGLKAFKGIKGIKAIKGIKGIKGVKLFKVTKGAKVAKSVKLAKKTKKARYEADEYVQKSK